MVDFSVVLKVSAFLFLCGCSAGSVQQPSQEGGLFEYSVLSRVEATKTALFEGVSKTSFSFVDGDEIGLFIGDLHVNKAFTCTDALSGIFSTRLQGLQTTKSDVVYLSYYPYNKSAGNTASELAGVLPVVQNAPFDPSADYMVATPINAPYDEDDMPSLNFSFSNHLFGIVKLSVKDGSSAYSAEKVLSLGLRSSSMPLVGNFTFDITDPSEPAEFSSTSGLTSKRVLVEYSEDSAPILGNDEIHSVYAVVNPASFSAGELSLELSTTNYVFTIPIKSTLSIQRNQLSVLPVLDISSSSVTRRNRIRTVVLWGDSITSDSFLQKVKKELGTNWNVVRGGVPGDVAAQVAGRQGGLPVVTGETAFTIPGNSSEYVVFDGIYTQEGASDLYTYRKTIHNWTLRTSSCPLINPVIINGVACEMKYVDETKKTYKIHRCTDGDDVTVEPRTPVSTFGSREYADADMIVVYMGNNSRPYDASNDSYLISVHEAMAAHLTNSEAKMMVLGFHHSTSYYSYYWTPGYVSSFTAAFGNYFIDQKTFGGGENAIILMKEIGQITDESQINATDLEYINSGNWPLSWVNVIDDHPDLHPNSYGDSVMAILLRRRMDELGML